MIIVSTDGTGLTDPGSAIGWAWVAHGSGRIDSGGASHGTAQVAELVALRQAVDAHPGDEPLFVESTSQYAIRCASEWLDTWKSHGWQTPAGGAVQHLDEVQALDRSIGARSGPVRFRWVRGHVDSPFTQRARELADLAARDWAAGRGDVDGALLDSFDGVVREAVGDTDDTRSRANARVPESVGVRSEGGRNDGVRSDRRGHDGGIRGDVAEPPTSGPTWELGTLFD